MNKSLKELLALNYTIEIEAIPVVEGGGYCASIPILGKTACRGDGESIEEAVESLNSIKEYLFAKWLRNGVSIPLPQESTIDEVSGRFLLRIPKELHFDLIRRARENETTLNQYCVYLLSKSFSIERVDTFMERLETSINQIQFKVNLTELSRYGSPAVTTYSSVA